MKPYSKYKLSGIEWIGEIPEHWELKKIKYKGKTLAGGTPATGNPDYWDGDIPWLNSGKVQNNIILYKEVDKYITQLGLNESATKMIKPHSVLVALTGATCGNIGYLTFQSTANQSVVAIENDSSLDSKFLYYFLLSQREQILIEKTGGAQSGINEGDVKNLFFCFPPLSEQTAIANYLDKKTAQIDDFIVKKQKLIELLKEERAAIINEAVSGEGKNWERKKLKYVAFIKYGLGQPPKQKDDGLPLIRATNIERGKINETDLIFIDPDDVPYERDPVLKENDIIVVRSGAYTADSAIIPKKYEGAITGYDMVVRVLKDNPFFIAYSLLSNDILINQLYLHRLRAAQPHLNKEELGETLFAMPSLNEQNKIVGHIQSETQKIDNTIDKIEKEIELIQEYRTALISEVVTGKIKVS